VACSQDSDSELKKAWEAYERGYYETAFSQYWRLAEQGDATAQFNLGVMYDQGRGVTQDDQEAVKWYRLAAEQGDATAQINLGVMYANGRGVTQDDQEAVKWYRLAAEQGNATAQFNLGVMYAKGQGVTQDDRIAHMWFNLLASFGNKDGANARDRIAARMTSNQVSEAQSFATECSDQNYKNCAQ
jgi:uncharacterized protein